MLRRRRSMISCHFRSELGPFYKLLPVFESQVVELEWNAELYVKRSGWVRCAVLHALRLELLCKLALR